MIGSLAKQVRAMGAAIRSAPLHKSMRAAVRIVRQSIRDNFTGSHGPDGRSWPDRKVSGDGHPLLMDTGALLQAATGGGAGAVTATEPRAATVGVDKSVKLGGIPGAGVHQYGYRAIPARPYLGASDAALDAIGEEIADDLLGSMLSAADAADDGG